MDKWPETITNKRESAEKRERIFDDIVYSHLLESFEDSLYDANFEEGVIGEIEEAVQALPEEDKKRFLAVPLEIQGNQFSLYKEKLNNGMTPKELVAEMVKTHRENGYTLGYHLSPNKISKKTNPDGSFQWFVKGTELDDRDNNIDTTNSNILMAYYSEDYLNRYTKKPGNYLYIIRAETGEKSSHKRDLKNRWGRAPSLSIISEVDMRDVEARIGDEYKKDAKVEASAS